MTVDPWIFGFSLATVAATIWMVSKHEPSEIARNEKPALESRRVRTQPWTVAT